MNKHDKSRTNEKKLKKNVVKRMSEIEEDKLRKEDGKTKIENKETPKELPVLRRMTKRQVQEVYSLFEEGKSLEEISKYFESRYNCKPLSKERLRKHLTNFYKLKDSEDNKTHQPQPPVSIITNQDIRELKEKMFSPSPANNLYSSESDKTVSKETEFSLPGIPLKFLVFVLIAILILFVILSRREKKEEKKKKSIKEPDPQNKPGNLAIKWV